MIKFCKRTLTAFLFSVIVVFSAAGPVNPSVVHGSAHFHQQGNRLTITNTPGTIINWQDFSIGTGELTRFQQQHTASAVLTGIPIPDIQGVVIDAEVSTSGGDIFVDAGETGEVHIYGGLTSSNHHSGQRGGDITVTGQAVGVFEDAVIDALGDGGGGNIRVGGGRSGQDDSIRNSNVLVVTENAQVRSDAGSEGDGGEVILYAHHTARIRGEISARGGEQGGDGGFVETSGRKFLELDSLPDVSSKQARG